jgi:hypothetical protein
MRAVLTGVAAALVLGSAASAATLTMVYTGTVTSGHDLTGVFGGPDLAGAAFEATLQFELETRRGGVGFQDLALYAGNASNFGTFSIDGQAMEINDDLDSGLHSILGGSNHMYIADRLPHPYDFGGTSYMYFVATRVLALSFASPDVPWYLSSSYDLDGTGGGFLTLYAFDKPSKTTLWDVGAAISLNHLKVTCAGADCVAPTEFVPEPSTWAMLVLGFGQTGAAVRANRRRTARL